eukprot:scaffold110757_cov21-Tisochrysis_lutea.AAC.1
MGVTGYGLTRKHIVEHMRVWWVGVCVKRGYPPLLLEFLLLKYKLHKDVERTRKGSHMCGAVLWGVEIASRQPAGQTSLKCGFEGQVRGVRSSQ